MRGSCDVAGQGRGRGGGGTQSIKSRILMLLPVPSFALHHHPQCNRTARRKQRVLFYYYSSGRESCQSPFLVQTSFQNERGPWAMNLKPRDLPRHAGLQPLRAASAAKYSRGSRPGRAQPDSEACHTAAAAHFRRDRVLLFTMGSQWPVAGITWDS